jgi:hypothetical protein
MKEKEAIYKRFMGLQPKVISKPFIQAINLNNKPIELMHFSAAAPELTSINLRKTGSNKSYEPAMNTYLSCKKLD